MSTAAPTRPPVINARDRRAKLIAALVATVTGLVTLAGVYLLVTDIRRYHETRDYLQPLVSPITGGELFVAHLPDGRVGFNWRGHNVLLTGDFDDEGRGSINLAFADASVDIPVGVPSAFDLPLMPRTEDWLKVLLFYEPRPGDTLATFLAAVEGKQRLDEERLVIVARRPNPGQNASRFRVDDTWAWGETQRLNWTFDFHECLPDGTISSQTFRFPISPTKQKYIDANLADPPDPSLPPPLDERSWQYYAALRTMPPGAGPKHTFKDSALTAAPFSLPLSAFSLLAFAVSLAFALAPARRTV